MGGCGSGNHFRNGTKKTVDAAKRLDIRYLKKHGMLQSGNYKMSWNRNGRPSGNASIRIVAGESMTVICNWRMDSSAEWQPMEKTVHFTSTACTYGGSRLWFVCPYCGRRVAVVILDAGHVACRHCLNLTYASCNDDSISQIWRKRDKYLAKMGGNKKSLHFKPKGMHRETWNRLRLQYYEADIEGWRRSSVQVGILKDVLTDLLRRF